MSRRFLFLLFLTTFANVSPSAAQNALRDGSTAAAAGPSFAPVAHPLKISAGDLLDLNVFDTPELSTKVRVDEHGVVTLPVAGDLSVSGMTAVEAGHAIEARFRQTDVLKEPHVSVTVLEYS